MLWREPGVMRQDFQHVHVTPYIYQHPEQFRILSVTGEENWSHYRWTVDTREDLTSFGPSMRRSTEMTYSPGEMHWNSSEKSQIWRR